MVEEPRSLLSLGRTCIRKTQLRLRLYTPMGAAEILAVLMKHSASAPAMTAAADALARRIADVLIEVGDASLSRAQIAAILNDRGVRTGHGKLWDKSRLRVPLVRAGAMILDDERTAIAAQQKANPLFGMF